MWKDKRRRIVSCVAWCCLLVLIAGCSNAPPPPPEKAAVLRHGVVNMQRLLEAHPEREKMRTLERSLAAAESKEAAQEALEAAKREFETAMEARRHQDNAELEKKQEQLREELGGQRRQFIEALEAQYRPVLFNLDLKLKTVQNSPAENMSLKTERERVEAEMRQKLVEKDDALAALFQQEMGKFAEGLSVKTNNYANKWMDDRMQRLKADSVNPEQEKRRQELTALSGKIMQDVKQAVAKVASQEKIDIVWTRLVARQQAIEITDAVARELTK